MERPKERRKIKYFSILAATGVGVIGTTALLAYLHSKKGRVRFEMMKKEGASLLQETRERIYHPNLPTTEDAVKEQLDKMKGKRQIYVPNSLEFWEKPILGIPQRPQSVLREHGIDPYERSFPIRGIEIRDKTPIPLIGTYKIWELSSPYEVRELTIYGLIRITPNVLRLFNPDPHEVSKARKKHLKGKIAPVVLERWFPDPDGPLILQRGTQLIPARVEPYILLP